MQQGNGVDFAGAQANCKKQSADLVIIKDIKTQSFVDKLSMQSK